jgi:hypothetical protein
MVDKKERKDAKKDANEPRPTTHQSEGGGIEEYPQNYGKNRLIPTQ